MTLRHSKPTDEDLRLIVEIDKRIDSVTDLMLPLAERADVTELEREMIRDRIRDLREVTQVIIDHLGDGDDSQARRSLIQTALSWVKATNEWLIAYAAKKIGLDA